MPLFNHQAYDLRVQAEMMALGARQTRPHLSLVVALLASLTGLHELSWQVIALWLFSASLIAAFGFTFRRRYLHADRNGLSKAQLRRGEWTGLAYSACVGVLWGSSTHLMIPGESEHNLIITMIYLGVGTGASAIAIFGLAHMLAGSLLSLGLLIAGLPGIFGSHWPGLAALFTLYNFVLVRTALERRDTIADNIRLAHDKERLLEQQKDEVARTRQASQEKSAFLAAASHDLRQPVHAVMLLGHALRLRLPAGENADLVERILEAGHALSEQFNNLMDLSRLEGGAYRLNPAALPLDHWLESLCATHGQLARDRGLNLRLRVDVRLRGRSLWTDRGLLGRVLDNLIGNAIKFAKPGTTILVAARRRSEALEIAVYDQGIGIPRDQFAQVFKPYVQLDNPTRDRAKGIGLGLSIVQEAASLLGARLQLESEPGRGSCFRLIFPDAQLAAASPGVVRSERKPPAVTNLHGRRLLLVEDDPMAASALVAWAQNWGLRVDHHADPATVDTAEQPDLILCDIRLPGERDGIDCLCDWLDAWPDARGLLVSGELLPETHLRAEQEGLLLLSKPVNPDLLLQTMSGLLRARA